jgi:RNA polymerase sigma factor (sigma-70 family)
VDQERDSGEGKESVSELTTEVWKTLFPTAIDLLRKVLREPESTRSGLRWMAPALYDAYPTGSSGEELREVQGAVASAVSEFLRWQRQTGLTEEPGEDELAFHLIRITYNRWKRRSRSDRKLRRATEVGQSPLDEEGRTLLSALADKNSAGRQEIVQQIRDVIDQILEDLSDRDRAIVQRYLEKEPQQSIAGRLGCHRATVTRVINRFRDRVRKLLGNEFAPRA